VFFFIKALPHISLGSLICSPEPVDAFEWAVLQQERGTEGDGEVTMGWEGEGD